MDDFEDLLDINLGLEGEKGDKGDKGDAAVLPKPRVLLSQLIDSMQGDRGRDGRDGRDGKDGADGANGLQGIIGETGLGEKGLSGDKGEKGEKGDSIRGAQGITGKNGDDGLSAYKIWLNEGNEGEEQDFIDSLKGKDGESANQWVGNAYTELNELEDTDVANPSNDEVLKYNSTTGKWEAGTVAGSGDVVGPASATNNAVARYDSTTGKLIQDSGVIIDDSDNMSGVGTLNTHTIPAGTGTIALITDTVAGAATVIFTARVDEAAGVALGDVVYINGATGNQMEASLAINNDFAKIEAIAVATEAGADNATISFQNFGELIGLDTSSYTEGDILYLDSVAGQLTATHPSGIQGVMRVARVVRVHASLGEIFIDIVHQTIANNHDGIMRYQLVNENTGTSASSAYTIVNDASHRSSFSMVGSNYNVVAGIAESLVIYNEGYNKTVNAVDGNFGFEWWTDVTDSHNLSATAKMVLSADGMLGLGVLVPTETIEAVGNMCLTHTATEADDHAIEIACDAAGFGDVKALDINYITGAISTAEEEAAIIINIDESSSTGGEVFGLEVVTTTLGSATVVGMKTGIGVDPIGQFVGTFVDAATVLNKAVDVTAALADGGAGNITTFVADNDTITIGLATKFEEIEVLIDTAASGAGIAPTFEFSTGIGLWSAFTPTDGTNGFRNTGIILFDDATVPTWATGTGTEFLIRITRTRNSLSTAPILDEIQVAAVTVFQWDKNADVTINDLTAAGATLSDLTASELVSTNGSKVLTSLAVATYPSLTEVAYVKGVTSAVQTQLDARVTPAVGENLTDVQELRVDATPDADHTATGLTTNTINAGATIAIGELCYLGSGGKWLLADADAAATATGMLGISVEASTDTNPMITALAGSFVRDDTYAWTVGAVLYVGLTAGDLTETAPSATGDIVRVAGYAVSADVVYFLPSGTWVEVA